MKLRLAIVLAAGFGLAGGPGGAEATEAAEALDGGAFYADTCAQCHGRTGRGSGSFPRLSGRSADFVTKRLETYRSEEKVGPNSMLMYPIATEMSDEQIAAVAEFISTTFR